LPTRAGSPQQHMPITVGPFYLTHPVNFPCGRKPEYPGKTHDFRQSVDFYSSHEDWVRVALRKFSLKGFFQSAMFLARALKRGHHPPENTLKFNVPGGDSSLGLRPVCG
jgi:hypothetical protein